ncbi:hypothetical protein SAMN04487833_12358 [Sarcina sp. DSM 11001]|uniref:hypothetical protein n=1 Tax=Sarcina sp. DSM 11001 TaxID=1798184 RepID=UPI00088ADA60|nr:hypothetical protein [Sarcina sp. DSM 11001]SDL59331.1 hypothetical protein SAMN04487833_12358 [Sarcina sp. DSM 11001]
MSTLTFVYFLDYKSDLNNGLSGSDFAEIINRRYGGQMELYRYVCAKLFNTPVEKITGEFYKAKQQSTTSIGAAAPHGCG